MTMLPKMRREGDKNLIDAVSGISAMQKELIELRKNQRTPGTVEVCEVCRIPMADYKQSGCEGFRDDQPRSTCPIETAAAGEGT